jgi:hypothetical protein
VVETARMAVFSVCRSEEGRENARRASAAWVSLSGRVSVVE